MNVVKIENLSKVSKLKYLSTQPVLLCTNTGKNAGSLGEILIHNPDFEQGTVLLLQLCYIKY